MLLERSFLDFSATLLLCPLLTNVQLGTQCERNNSGILYYLSLNNPGNFLYFCLCPLMENIHLVYLYFMVYLQFKL